MCFCSENVDFRGGGACMAGGVWRGACMVGGACVAGGCAWWGACMAGGWQRGGVCGRGVCMVGGMHGRGVAEGRHVWQGGMHGGAGVCMAGGCVWQGGMHGGGHAWPCDLSHHAFEVTCMLSPHQLRPTNSAPPYIVLVGHVTRTPPLLTESQTGVKT